LLFVLFLVLFWRRSRGCTALWLSSLKATDAVPTQELPPSGACSLPLGRSYHRSCRCSTLFVHPVPKTP